MDVKREALKVEQEIFIYFDYTNDPHGERVRFRLTPVHTIFRNESSLFQNESCIALIGLIPDCLPYSGKVLIKIKT